MNILVAICHPMCPFCRFVAGQSCSSKLFVHDARHPASGDDEVVMDADVERAAGVDDILCHRDIFTTWLQAARGMIVRQDQCGCVMQQGEPHDFPRMRLHTPDCAFPHDTIEQEMVGRVKEEHSKIFARRAAHVDLEISSKRFRSRQHGSPICFGFAYMQQNGHQILDPRDCLPRQIDFDR